MGIKSQHEEHSQWYPCVVAESSSTCGENTLAHRAVKSPRCMPEANIILCVNYTQISKRKTYISQTELE